MGLAALVAGVTALLYVAFTRTGETIGHPTMHAGRLPPSGLAGVACLRACLASMAACQSIHETSGAGRAADHGLSGLSVPGSSSPSATKRSMSASETETDIA